MEMNWRSLAQFGPAIVTMAQDFACTATRMTSKPVHDSGGPQDPPLLMTGSLNKLVAGVVISYLPTIHSMPLVSVKPPLSPTAPWNTTLTPLNEAWLGMLKLTGVPASGSAPLPTGRMTAAA